MLLALWGARSEILKISFWSSLPRSLEVRKPLPNEFLDYHFSMSIELRTKSLEENWPIFWGVSMPY